MAGRFDGAQLGAVKPSITLKGKAMSHDTYELKAELRERVGKGSSRELRRNGRIPAVIYGDKQTPCRFPCPARKSHSRSMPAVS